MSIQKRIDSANESAGEKFQRFDVVLSLVGGRLTRHELKEDGTETYIYHDGQTPVTDADIDAEIVRLETEYDAQEYARSRKTDYPEIGDQLDALYHAGVFPANMAARIKETKDKYPK